MVLQILHLRVQANPDRSNALIEEIEENFFEDTIVYYPWIAPKGSPWREY